MRVEAKAGQLFDWLRSRCHPDLSRRISPYIEPYPLDYARLILQPDYAPDSGRLIDDYLRHNPTRNRALDMLPVFAHLDEARVGWKALRNSASVVTF